MATKAIIAAILGVAFVLGAGSSPSADGGTPPAPPSDACALLTQAQVSAVLGVSVGAGQRIVPTSSSICGWTQSNDTTHGDKRVVVSIYVPLGHLTPTDQFNNVKKPIQGIVKMPVSGVGDDAILVTTPGFGTGLIFKKGSSVFDVRVYGFSDEQTKAKEKALALDIIAKL
jgi:hypothetical protein